MRFSRANGAVTSLRAYRRHTLANMTPANAKLCAQRGSMVVSLRAIGFPVGRFYLPNGRLSNIVIGNMADATRPLSIADRELRPSDLLV